MCHVLEEGDGFLCFYVVPEYGFAGYSLLFCGQPPRNIRAPSHKNKFFWRRETTPRADIALSRALAREGFHQSIMESSE